MRIEYYTVKTPHFIYTLRVEEQLEPFHALKFFVGSLEKPCLEASLYLKDIDPRFADVVHICTLYKIDALQECAIESSDEHSFGTELLYSFLSIIRTNFSHITEMRLTDASYLPCNRTTCDTLDMLTYSIALYGKTWYELKTNAHIRGYPQHNMYYDSVKTYMSPATKFDIPFSQLLKHIMIHNPDTSTKFHNNLSEYETMYNTSATFPEFFRKLSKTVPKDQKCKFFKAWLESFIEKHVHRIVREWTIDLHDNDILKNVLNVSKAKPMRNKTRKARKH